MKCCWCGVEYRCGQKLSKDRTFHIIHSAVWTVWHLTGYNWSLCDKQTCQFVSLHSMTKSMWTSHQVDPYVVLSLKFVSSPASLCAAASQSKPAPAWCLCTMKTWFVKVTVEELDLCPQPHWDELECWLCSRLSHWPHGRSCGWMNTHPHSYALKASRKSSQMSEAYSNRKEAIDSELKPVLWRSSQV